MDTPLLVRTYHFGDLDRGGCRNQETYGISNKKLVPGILHLGTTLPTPWFVVFILTFGARVVSFSELVVVPRQRGWDSSRGVDPALFPVFFFQAEDGIRDHA